MTIRAITPEDVLPDEANTTRMGGREVRKGTIAAILANAEILQSDAASDDDKERAMSMIRELAPAAVAVGLHNHIKWKDKRIQDVFDLASK